ncbi:hypothetical protein EVAR_33444_1 [Eumeta japonica]|uniref:Uncharacterized protein n=1 Tax=Eumeta variegata TaxID=151549 RepID=A0A4C1W4I5_EUMVA|nr:hypothetical protein EVAR_33444_1 [Eumeta japonica]
MWRCSGGDSNIHVNAPARGTLGSYTNIALRYQIKSNQKKISLFRRLCAAAVSLLLGHIGRWSGREIARSALSLARSAQAERDNKSCIFVSSAADINSNVNAEIVGCRANVCTCHNVARAGLERRDCPECRDTTLPLQDKVVLQRPRRLGHTDAYALPRRPLVGDHQYDLPVAPFSWG